MLNSQFFSQELECLDIYDKKLEITKINATKNSNELKPEVQNDSLTIFCQ